MNEDVNMIFVDRYKFIKIGEDKIYKFDTATGETWTMIDSKWVKIE